MGNGWIPARPIVGFNADGSLITVDSWSGKQRGSTLTESEREAIEQAIDAVNGMEDAEPWTADALRGLLERLG